MRTNPDVYRWLTRALAGSLLMALLLAFTVPGHATEPGEQGGSKLKVMTYNVYCGTAFAGATDADLARFKDAMTTAVVDVRASDPAGRAQAVAGQIVAHSPHLVSLQEVFTVSSGASKENLTLEFDYLQLLLDALAAQGAFYTPVQSVTTWDATVPTSFGYLRATWRIVILARTDLKPEHFFFTNVDGKPFSTTISYALPALNGSTDCPVPLQTDSSCVMPWPRGWAFADVTYRGKQFRYVNATLESNSNSRNLAQGKELLNGALKTTLPLVLAGDLNCDPSDSKRSCSLLLAAGLNDAWGAAKPSEPGFTKELPVLTMRSDYVMLRDLFDADAAALVGEAPADITASGVWPSNHAGVVVKLNRP